MQKIKLTWFATMTLLLSFVSGCGFDIPSAPPSSLGDFTLAQTIVLTDTTVKGLISREASVEDFSQALETAVQEQLAPYKGSKPYIMGIRIEGYNLAPPGIPVVLSPKSALILYVSIWQKTKENNFKNEHKERFLIFETLSPELMIGTGHTRTRQQQIDDLSKNAALQISQWLGRNVAWFQTAEP